MRKIIFLSMLLASCAAMAAVYNSGGIAVIDTETEYPVGCSTGTLVYVKSKSRLMQFDGTAWSVGGDSTTAVNLSTISVSFLGVSSAPATMVTLSSAAVSYTAISTNSLNLSISSAAVSYTAISTDVLKLSLSSAAAAYLGISSTPASSLSLSSAAASYLGISSVPASSLSISSAANSYVGISTVNFSTYSLAGLDIRQNGRLTTNGQRVGLTFSVYSPVGAGYTFTTTTNTLNVATSSTTITLTSSGTYLLFGECNVNYVAATFAAVQTMTFAIYRQNNTPGVVPSAFLQGKTRIITTTSDDAGEYQLPPIVYSTLNTNDVLSLHGSLTAAPSAGSVQANQASLLAIRLY